MALVSLPFFNLFCSFIFFSSIKLSVAAVDAISQGSFIRDSENETLVSLSQSFELGFFSPGNSKYRYLGIWYKKSPETVVWVANRNNPTVDREGVFRIRNNGDLVLLNEKEGIVWSSNRSSRVENAVAKLLDTGNLVLVDNSSSSESYLWQSFDYPSDTMLPGMNLGWDSKTGVERYLTLWRNASDPSPGDFSFRLDIDVLPQMSMYEGSMKVARTGPWNGAYFGGQPAETNLLFVPILDDNQDGIFFRYESFNNPVIMLLKLKESGKMNWLIWDERSNGWIVPYSGPEDLCGNYGYCGANSVCSIDKTSSCECLKGFRPKGETSSRGCVANFSIICEAGDGFVKLAGIKLPDLLNASLSESGSMSLEECETECLKNCSCRAYTNSSLASGGSGCLMWHGDLIDIRYVRENRGAKDIYIRVPVSDLDTNRRNRTSVDSEHKTNKGNGRKLLTILITIISLIVVSLGFFILYMRRKLRRKGEDLLKFNLEMNLNADQLELTEVKKLGRSKRKQVKLPLFSFASVSAATDNFSTTNKLGEGGFGPVYKGLLIKGQEIAVKRLSRRSGQGWEELRNEAVLIAKLQHKNLVRLLGCCIEQDEKILIYEYMPNRSLDILLFDPTKSWLLDWEIRVQIIEGIAQGLLYLHEHSGLRIIHRDLKASNILLDKDMNPKISDFGMATIFGANELQANTNRIGGTFGYMSPEYALEGIFSMKSDVFSFGVLMLEIVSGKKNTSFHQTDSLNLIGYAWDMWSSNRGLDLLDPVLEDVPSKNMLLRYIKTALLCVQEIAEDRPSIV